QIAGIEIDSLLVSRGGTGPITLLFEHHGEIAIGKGRFRLKFDGMLKLGRSLFEFALLKCRATFGDIQVRILIAVVRGRKLPPLLQLSAGIRLLSRSRQSEAELIVGLAAFRCQTSSLLELGNRLIAPAILEKRFAQGQMGARKSRSQSHDLLQLL